MNASFYGPPGIAGKIEKNNTMRKKVLYCSVYIFIFILSSYEVFAISRRHDVSDHQYIQLAANYPSVG